MSSIHYGVCPKSETKDGGKYYMGYIWSSLGRLALNHESSRYLLFLCSNYGLVNPLGISTIFGDHLHNPDQRKVVH